MKQRTITMIRNMHVVVVTLSMCCVMLITLTSTLHGDEPDSKIAPVHKQAPARQKFEPQHDEHWPYRKLARPTVPSVKHPERVKNPIDAFLEREFDRYAVVPNLDADQQTLIRRLCLDVTGLPPSPELAHDLTQGLVTSEISKGEGKSSKKDRAADVLGNQSSSVDQSPIDRLIDRLLASPRFGERWARVWLDQVHFAESDGYRFDYVRPWAFRYRDYVIRSLNQDKPFDRFVHEQLAGDELSPDDPVAWVATGFLRQYPLEESDTLLFARRRIILADITDNVASTFLGLTFHCARCHDHRFDPILQEDYFKLQAFFAGYAPTDVLTRTFVNKSLAIKKDVEQWAAMSNSLKQQLERAEKAARDYYREGSLKRFPPEVKQAFETPANGRTPLEQQIARDAFRQVEMPRERLQEKLGKNRQWVTLISRADELARQRPEWAGQIMAFTDIGMSVPETYIGEKGTGSIATPGIPSCFPKAKLVIEAPANQKTSGNRLALARWLTSDHCPQTARVMVNRIWQGYFGVGLVPSTNDFGSQGEPASHPELLDWLACELVASGWKLKHIHRLILTSRAYQRSASHQAANAEIDPSNRLLWKMNRKRVDADMLRDSLLAVSGLLDTKMFGPGVFPPLPAGVESPDLWPTSKYKSDHYRRSIYTFARRNLAHPMADAFDQPDCNISCGKREQTTTPIQALIMMHNRLVIESANAVALAVCRADTSVDARINKLYERTLGRLPTAAERAIVLNFLAADRAANHLSNQAANDAAPEAGDDELEPSQPAAKSSTNIKHSLKRWQDLAHALLASNEFVFID